MAPEPGSITKPQTDPTAAAEAVEAIPQTAPATPPPSDPPTPNPAPSSGWQGWLKQHWRLVVMITAAVLLVAVGGAYAWLKMHPKPKAKPVVVKAPPPPTPPPAPTTLPSPLTGEQVSPDLAKRPITAVVIENHTDARPQSGLADAGVVYEALAEGGITRFLAFYLNHLPKELGPVRSVRTYFVSWALEFNAPVAHAGGNADALDLIGPLGMKDMNEFSWGANFYRSNDRYAPHNLYTTPTLLDQLEGKLGYSTPADFTPSPRKPDKPTAPAPAATIDIDYSYNGYQVEYRYDGNCNCYNRFLAGAPHIDRNTGAQIKVKNVVVEYMPTAYGTTRIGEQTVRMGDSGMPIGSNKALVFSDGAVTTGTWNKPSNKERTRLLDASGKDIPLDVGNTWYSIVPLDHTATYH